MSQPSAPKAPGFADFKQMIQFLENELPKQLRIEDRSRGITAGKLGLTPEQFKGLGEDEKRVLMQQYEQKTFGPEQYRQQLTALQQLDPQRYAVRQGLGDKIQAMLQRGNVDPLQAAAYNQLGQGVMSQYARGATPDPASLNQWSQAIRSRQGQDTALGNAPAMAEAVYLGQRGQQLQQQRTQNLAQFGNMQSQGEKLNAQAGSYLSLPSAMSDINQIQGVQPDRANAYLNPNISSQGIQGANAMFGNQLGAFQAGGGATNPWMNALGGAASGAAAGASFGGGYGAAAGGIIGGLGGYFSDARLKNNISRTGLETRDLIPIMEFDMDGKRYRGVIAQDVITQRPDAVGIRDGFYTVDYGKLGIKMEEI